MSISLQKFIADSGYCSRRQAESLIKQGRVAVNGQSAELGMRASAEDKVEIDGQPVSQRKKPVYIALNKPKDYTCTNRKFKNEKNIFELVDTKDRLFCVGRLDKDSRGLVLLTNDGDLTRKLTHPGSRHKKKYTAQVQSLPKGKEPAAIAKDLKKGVEIIDERKQAPYSAKALGAEYLGKNKFEIIITEGKKRQIRKMLAALGLRVEDLERIEFAGVKLGGLRPGKWRYLTNPEIKRLKN